ncbi:helix-turn-helix domain-containing protein [Pedobacter sp.]
MNVGKILKYLRKQKGVTQFQISNFLNMDRTAYSKLERNQTMLKIDTAKLIAVYYGFELHYLILCIEYEHYLHNPTTIRLIKAQKSKEENFGKQVAYSA